MALHQPVCGMMMVQCYDYDLTVYGDGRVVYEEHQDRFPSNDIITTSKTYQVSEDKVRDLFVRFNQLNFFSLNDRYDTGPTDCGSSTTSLIIGGKSKTVYHYDCAPDVPSGLSDLESAIDNIVDAPEPSRVPTAQSEWKTSLGRLTIDGSPVTVDGLAIFALEDHGLFALETGSGEEKWRLATEEGPISSPTLQDGVIYCGIGISGYIYAVDSHNGNVKWKSSATGDHISPGLVADGMVYFGTQQEFNNQYDGFVYALDAQTGTVKWQVKVPGGASGVIVSDGVLYYGSGDGNLYAVDSKSGHALWQFPFSSKSGGVSTPVIAKGVLYFSADDTFYAFDAWALQERWHYNAEHSWFSDPVLHNGTLYVAVNAPGLPVKKHQPEAPSVNYILALDATGGQEMWRFTTSCCVHGVSLAGANRLCFGDGDAVYALDTNTHQAILRYEITDEDWLDGAPVWANGKLYWGDYGGNAIAVQNP